MNKISKLLVIATIIFSFTQLFAGGIFAADDSAVSAGQDLVHQAHEAASAAKFDEAISLADEAIQINPDFVDAYNTRGYARIQKKLYKKAIEDFDRAIKLKPGFAEAYINRGSAKFYLGLYDNCVEDQSTAIKLYSNQDTAYVFRASAYYKKKLYDLAIADYSRAIEIAPRASRYNSRADAYRQKSEYDLAIKDYNRSIELDPAQKGLDSYSGREMAYKAKGQVNEAAGDLKQAGVAGGARVLAPFSGYAEADTCKQSGIMIPGVPWQPDAAKDDATVALSELGQYEALLRHTMQVLRLMYGAMSATEDKSFDAFWAPFFDHPTKAGLEYFKVIAPLLDETVVTLNNLDGLISNLGVGLQEVLLEAGDQGSVSAGIAAAAYQSIKSQRAKFDELVKKIEALGNPPNPLATKCRARKRHRQAISTPAALAAGPDILDALRKTNYFQLAAINTNMHQEKEGYITEWEWDGNTFKFVFQTNSQAFNYESPCQGTTVCGAREEVSGILSEDGKTIKKLFYKKDNKCCDRQTQGITQPSPVRFEAVDIPILDASVGPMGIEIHYGGDSPAFNQHITSMTGCSVCNYVGCDIKIAFTKQTPWTKVDGWSLKFEGFKAAPTQKQDLAPADPEKDPAVIKEAIAQHLALAAQARRDASRWAADAKAESNPERCKELEKRAGEISANAQTEQDIADSLQTGTIVHTRTAWDEQQHQELINNIKTEIAIFNAENKILTNIPEVGNMVGGIEGVEMREDAQKRISEALKSPNRLQMLSEIYGELQTKVVDQGEQQMATEQAKVEMWDNRIYIAENVQFAASSGILFGALWAPAEIGSLALGFAGSTGFAEGGVKGAVVAITRSVSPRADIIISAYEGATRIDPATGQPEGAWGAIKGALWSIGTNKAFEKLGSRIQKFKADYSLAKQGAGGAGFKAVARAKGDARIKEYDFKPPEQRYKEAKGSAKTPQEKAAVDKKYAIQAEREKMNLEIDGAKQKAENDIRQGIDPAKVKENYNKDLNNINEKYKDKTRNKEHEEVLKELGFDAKKDIKPTGSAPKTAASDMDFTPDGPTPHEAYQKGKSYVEAMQKRGHSVDEYGDRWVDNTNDSTIWKPGFGADKPGSSSFESEVIFGTLPHSDKFGTKGGIEWTSSPTHTTDDPLGAVLANAGKAAGAGLGNAHPKDLHTIGKSAAKAAEASGIEVDPHLKAQIDALKAHQTPDQTGVVELGADQATKDKQVNSFLGKVEALMGRAYNSAKAKSDQRAKELQPEPTDKSDAAYDIRAKLASYKAGNNAALTTIAQASPGLGKAMAPTMKVPEFTPGISVDGKGVLNLGGFARELFADRQSATKAPPPPADAKDPAFNGLGKRCKEGANRLQDKLSVAKPGSEEARYLTELKSALEQGENNPAEAVRTVRGLSGTELAVVLAQLGVPAEKKAQ